MAPIEDVYMACTWCTSEFKPPPARLLGPIRRRGRDLRRSIGFSVHTLGIWVGLPILRSTNQPPTARVSAWADRIEYWAVDDIDCAPPEEALPVCEACVEALVERLLADEKTRAVTPPWKQAG